MMDRNEAIRRIKAWDLDSEDMEVLRELIPELAESEDERIRKDCIKYLDWEYQHCSINEDKIKIEKCIAWLEKKGSQILANSARTCNVEPTRFKVGDTIRLKGSTIEHTIKSIDGEYYRGKGWLVSISGEDNYELVKQRPAPFKAEHGKYYYCIKNYFSGGKKWASKGDVVQALKGLPIMGLDDASEFFLPVNNMQLNNITNHNDCPKFKVGDWITDNKNTFQIVRAENNWYYADDGDKIRFDVVHQFYHLWTIQDAKDGDMLATLDYILIFKKRLPKAKDGGVSYCHYDFGSGNPQFIWYEDRNWYFGKEAIIHPATKEQRVLLFKVMQESDYQWDAEKKELKKIEQKPADKVEPKFKVGDWIVRDSDGFTTSIKSVKDEIYYFYQGGNLFVKDVDECFHLWTIEDAKDGDVLAEHETIVLFKKIEGQNIRCYCTYHYLGFNPALHVDTLQNKKPYLPATQEQRDLLFQKMKEAGYERDEKKELKKIEQKLSTSVTEFDTEVEKFCKECFITDTNEKGKVFCIARHFADWQKKRDEGFTSR